MEDAMCPLLEVAAVAQTHRRQHSISVGGVMTKTPTDNVTPIRRDDGFAGNTHVASDLLAKRYPDLHWNINSILPAGTMLLFGRPKKGKSFLTLNIAICVAAGRAVFGQTTSGKRVLYLALEDSERRLQQRLRQCSGSLGIPPDNFAEKLHLSTTSKRIDTGLIDELRDWMTAFEDTGLVVIDMLKKISAAEDRRRSLYEQQAEAGHALTKLSHEYPYLSIVVVHHSRKMQADDPFDMVSGTTGLSGSYDSLAAIADSPGTRVLHITGRDVESVEIPLLMNERGMYTLAMPDSEHMAAATMSDTRSAVYDAVPRGQAYKRADIIAGCKLDEGTVDQQLIKLVKQGLVEKVGYGMYQKTGKRFYEDLSGDY